MKRAIDDITNFIFMEDRPEPADIIFIVGGTYAEPAELAARLYNQGFAPWIMPSGKFAARENGFPGCKTPGSKYQGKYETEWEFMCDILCKNGVSRRAILREDQSQFTYQNAEFSKKVAQQHHLQVKKAILCCQAFHARRAFMYYQTAFLQTHFMVQPASTQGISRGNWMCLEHGKKLVMGEMMRIGEQFLSLPLNGSVDE